MAGMLVYESPGGGTDRYLAPIYWTSRATLEQIGRNKRASRVAAITAPGAP